MTTESDDLNRRLRRLEEGAVDQRLFDERTSNLQKAIDRIELRQATTSAQIKTALIALFVNLSVTVVGGLLVFALSHK